MAYEADAACGSARAVMQGKNVSLSTFLRVAGVLGLGLTTSTDEVARTVKNERRAMGLSRRDMARHMGVNPGTIEAFENGRKGITMMTLEKICEELGLDLMDVLEEA